MGNLDFSHVQSKYLLLILPLMLTTGTLKCQFGCGISKMVGPKKQDFCPKINMLKGNFDTNNFEPLMIFSR